MNRPIVWMLLSTLLMLGCGPEQRGKNVDLDRPRPADLFPKADKPEK